MNIVRACILLVCCCLFLPACSARVIAQKHPHIIVDKEGYPVTDFGERMSREDYRARIESIRRAVAEKISDREDANQPLNLLLLVHGGLTTTDGGLAFIDDMVDGQGFLKGMPADAQLYPIFINWDSSLMSSLVDDLFLVRKGTRDPLSGIITSPFVILSRLVGGFVNLPATLYYHYDTEKMQFEKWPGEPWRGGDLARRGAITVAMIPFTVVQLPFLSGFGTGAWEMMSRRVELMFAHQLDPQGTLYREPDHRPGALREFFELIESSYGTNSGGPTVASAADTSEGRKPRVNVILAGHSMGTMVVNRILREFPQLRYHRIVYMASAASVDDFITTVPPYLARNRDAQFIGYSLAIRDEVGESNLLAPRGSLLAWIDNMFEPGLSPTGKRAGFFFNNKVLKVREFDDEGKACDRMRVWKIVADGDSSVPHKHGDFNEDGKFQGLLATAMGWEGMHEKFFTEHRVCLRPGEVPDEQ